jgi:predicted AAA+ superfamily ATPase
MQQLIGRYGLDPVRCAFFNCEDPRLASALSFETLARLVEGFRGRHPRADELCFFIDEIQWIDGWQRWIRMQLERPRGHVFIISGSNANLLSGELSTVLTGRHLTVELFPFDLGECRAGWPDTDLADDLVGGGFPEPRGLPGDRARLLRQYFQDIVERDVRERVRARSSLAIRQAIQMVFESAGAELSLRRIAAAAGVAVDSARTYIEGCEAAYLLFSCPWFAFSERKRAVRNRKYYPVDTALRRVVATRTGDDRGKALECAVHLALRREFGQVFYWRDEGEVDFVLHHDGRVRPIQVTWDAPTERHHKSLDAFYERFPQADEAVFVTAATFETELARL